MDVFQQKKDLIMGAISNIPLENIKIFLKSLEQTGFTGETVLFIENIDNQTQEIIKDFKLNVKLIPIQRVGSERNFMIHDYRFSLYYKFLLVEGNRFNNILLTDVRDVFFQTNPFLENWSKDSITVTKEAWLIRQEINWNVQWILTKFGHKVLSAIQHQPILNAGTIFGPTKFMIDYLKELTHVLFDNEYVPISDQSSLNYLVHTGIIKPVAYSDNENGPIMTLALENQININQDNQVLLKNGNSASILHQYDRHGHLIDLLRSKITI
ncbi:hypothetical protein J2S09_003816 [Bacillus fengqiuensis]|nr:hypothetical protein [Bacillus fengqiuensis]